ncbi:MAG TPA: hypothetical protein VG939_05895, partial [Caulobacteraceae bacterium]|nr:hypothetical protein [Caulobacteraceae bacterium]
MALSQRIVWTLLPNGFNPETGRLKASILVSPRLTLSGDVHPQTLSWFKDWEVWPKTVKAAKFSVSVDGGAPQPLKLVSQPDDEVWTALFPASTFVRPFTFTDLRGKAILSYPVGTIAAGIWGLYGQLAVKAGDDLPSRRDLSSLLQAATPKRSQHDVLRALRGEAKKPGSSSDLRSPAGAIDLITAYHTPLEAPKTQSYVKKNKADPRESATWISSTSVALPKADDFKTLVDFHRIVASLAQYPELNRKAGLAIAVELDPGAVPDGTRTLQLAVTWPKAGGGVATDPDVLPPVVARRQGQAFEPAPRAPASPISGRFLRLQGGGFDLVQTDVDGAALKLKNLATNIARAQPKTYDDEDFDAREEVTAGAPTLRSAGLMLSQERRDLAIQALFARNGELQDKLTGNQPLPALYADDLIRGWRVDIREGAAGPWRSLHQRKAEYGFANTGGSLTTAKEEGMARLASASAADGSNPDVLKIHEGLFAWRGWSLSAPEPGKVIQPDESIGPANDGPPDGLPLKTHFTPTGGSLPKLRFGRSYAVRVRLVDLAGESQPFSEADAQSPDAVSNVVRYLRHEPVEAPALALVKTAHGLEAPADGESMARLAIRTFNATPAANTVPTKDRARRHLVPPRVTHRFAEQHGVMDLPGGKLDAGLFATLASLDKPLDEAKLKSGPKAIETTYAVAAEGFTLPYLPDPLAIGVAIRIEGAEGLDPAVIHKIPLYGPVFDPAAKPAWPKALPFTLVVAETGAADAAFDPARREFVVPLRKGERARLRISSLIHPPALASMAVSQMILDQHPPAAQLQALSQRAVDGQHWMLTPWKTVELVHAVQKPLITPELTVLTAPRKLGQIFATPTYRARLHGKTTARIDLIGSWSEPLDDPSNAASRAGPVAQPHVGHAYQTPVARNGAPGNWYGSPGLQHVFGDTRYRRVTYVLDATTRYREFMPEAIRGKEDELKVSSPPQRTWAANAAPPPPPKVLYVVPTFGWTRRSLGDRTASLRAGGGLRVYLDRPWFASGF